jgi:transcriptional regulator with XRE-family HTH domain
MSTALGRYIDAEMKARGWEQADLARESKVSKATISRIIGGQTDRPTDPILYKIATALGLTLNALLAKASAAAVPPATDPEDLELWARVQAAKTDPQRRVFLYRMLSVSEDLETSAQLLGYLDHLDEGTSTRR